MDQEVTVQTMSYQAETRMFGKWFNISPQSNTSVCLALVEMRAFAGCLPSTSAPTCFSGSAGLNRASTYKYRDPLRAQDASFTMHPTFNIYSIQLGLAYHF